VVGAVASLSPARVLDVACGTGYLTRHLPGEVFGLDQSAAMLRAARVQAPSARLVRGDALALPFPDRAFGRVFTAHFYGHLLPDERAAFLAEAGALGDELVVVDAGPRGGPPRDEWQDRRLSDGSAHRVFKRFFEGAALAAELGGGRVLHDGYWFVAVSAETASAPARRAAPQDGWGD
jgi:SAM-dependent methyltransferase